MKAEVIADSAGVSITAESDEEEEALNRLNTEIQAGGHCIYGVLRNGRYNIQLTFNEKEQEEPPPIDYPPGTNAGLP